MEKAYKLGIMVGRFQTFHKGHQSMVDKALELCDKVGIFIGSSQESGTNKNPFTYEMRESVLRKVYGDTIEIYPLPDIGVGNNSTWGDYVLDNVTRYFGELPELLISGKEGRRIDWFDSMKGLSIAELYIPKTVDISASEMREMLIKNDFESWKNFCDCRLWDSFSEMRELVLASYQNGETSSI
ncbi:MAG: adenylyltransferase/cytidyltransferase family protein [Clostridiales bacterium]|nr:adenylyltransferase/cytidyltransferase family protein [Clostridiales bacterium]